MFDFEAIQKLVANYSGGALPECEEVPGGFRLRAASFTYRSDFAHTLKHLFEMRFPLHFSVTAESDHYLVIAISTP